MARDIQFEIQYLLSLTLVVFGLLSLNSFKSVIDPRIGHFVILFLAIHLAMFNIYYGYGEALDFSIDFVDRMTERSSITLFTTTMSFAYFILHWIFASIRQYVDPDFYQVGGNGEILMDYLIPLFIIALMGYLFDDKVSGPRSTLRDINIKVFPQEVRVFSTLRDSKPFTVKIGNGGESTFEYTLEISVPNDVVLHHSGATYEGSFEEGEALDPKKVSRKTFELTYDGDTRALDEIEVTVHFDGGSKTEHVQADLIA